VTELGAVIRDLGSSSPEKLIAARLVLDGLCALEPGAVRWDSLVTLLGELANEAGQIPEGQDRYSEVLAFVRELAALPVDQRRAALGGNLTFAEYRDRRRKEWASAGLLWKE
jgi:hypothetical protein